MIARLPRYISVVLPEGPAILATSRRTGLPKRRRSIPVRATLATAALLVALPAAAQHHGTHDERALTEDPRLAPGQIAPVLEGLGDLHHPVTTSSEQAQLFFDQGLRLAYAFNHQEALRAFKEAARLDPDCAMAYWGWAYVLGPNLNLAMQPEAVPQAWEAIQQAVALRDKVSPSERAYIDALAKRFSVDPEADRAPLDRAFADAMREVHRNHPADPDAAVIFAAALMELSPWNYWTPDGRPGEQTEEFLAVLEEVIRAHPKHIGALHFYIHAVEAADPDRGEAAADALRGLAPGAGHLVHMPSHIYMQVGRYGDSIDLNRMAARADEDYITQCKAQGIYPLAYYPHNLHFLTWAAMMKGQAATALETARKVASEVPADSEEDSWGIDQTFLGQPLLVMVRFGMWDDILAAPEPEHPLRYLNGLWRYARGMALLRTGGPGKARRELRALEAIAAEEAAAEQPIGFSDARTLLRIAAGVLGGEIEAARGRYEAAVARLERAVRLQDGLPYTEPPDWYYPVRHTLGAVLLEAGRPEEAETVYWQDLDRFPENGYSLMGLARSLAEQGDAEGAAAAEQRFRAAWDGTDVTLAGSRL